MTSKEFRCPYCCGKPFRTARGLLQHQQQTRKCYAAIQRKFGAVLSGQVPHAYAPFASIPYATKPPNISQHKNCTTVTYTQSTASNNSQAANEDETSHVDKRQRTDDDHISLTGSDSDDESDDEQVLKQRHRISF